MKPFYITTTLPYVNSDPHIGFAMEVIRADVIARHKKNLGHEVFFNTGTDEHGVKIYQKAEEEGITPKELTDRHSKRFRELGESLGLSEDINFIRTTDEKHISAAKDFWKVCDNNGFIEKRAYKGLYCNGCELFLKEKDLVDGKCQFHPDIKPVEIEEENYFFKASAFKDQLLDHYKNNPNFVTPDFRLNEITKLVESGFDDFSISRVAEKMPWGIPVPGDDSQVMYVWFDALVNYISTLGWPNDMENFNKFWTEGETVQYAGKDNLRQQSAMWQSMLMAAGLAPTGKVIINGFITSGGQKISKSTGNVIDPFSVVDEYGTDALRYYVLRELNPYEDGDFTMDGFKEAYNANLANGIGNLANRIMKMSEDHLDSAGEFSEEVDTDFIKDSRKEIENFNLQKAMDHIWSEIQSIDNEIAEKEPFKLIKTDKDAAKEIISGLRNRLGKVSVALKPFLPETAEKIKQAILENKKPEIALFLRKD